MVTTTEGCGLVDWAGRLSQQVFQSLLNEAAWNHLIVPASIKTKLFPLLSGPHTFEHSNSPSLHPTTIIQTESAHALFIEIKVVLTSFSSQNALGHFTWLLSVGERDSAASWTAGPYALPRYEPHPCHVGTKNAHARVVAISEPDLTPFHQNS